MAANPRGINLVEVGIIAGLLLVLTSIGVQHQATMSCEHRVAEAEQVLRGIYAANLAYFGAHSTFTLDVRALNLEVPAMGQTKARSPTYDFALASAAPADGFTAVASRIQPGEAIYLEVQYLGPDNPSNGRIRRVAGVCR